MSSVIDLIWHDGKLFGQPFTFWAMIGWLGQAVFFSRFLVQWFATEKKKQVVVPTAFWWLSLVGCLLLLIYAIHRRDPVIIFGYVISWIPYVRNLVIHYRHTKAHTLCVGCETKLPPEANFCPNCGVAVEEEPTKS